VLYAVSYDTQDVLARFAARHGISYRLLSDEGSVVIERLGLLDRDLDRHHAEFGRTTRAEQRGVAYPVTFVLAGDGTVVAERRQRDYRTRESGASLLSGVGVSSASHGGAARVAAGPLRATASLDTPRVSRYRLFRAIVDIEVHAGWHLYGDPAPPGCTPLALTALPDSALEIGMAHIPLPVHLGDELHGHVGRLRLELPLSYRIEAGGGDRLLALSLAFQACSDTECLPPSEVDLRLRVPFEEIEA
jgi:hypothetical protein